MNNFEKIVEFEPAFDKRHLDSSKNYGVHGVDLKMILKGERGVVQFVLFTNWHLQHVMQEFLNKPILNEVDIKCRFLPMPADLGYHSPVPIYEGQTTVTDNCKYLNGKPCYYDGSGLNAERIYKVLLEKGSDGAWKELEDFYNSVFN